MAAPGRTRTLAVLFSSPAAQSHAIQTHQLFAAHLGVLRSTRVSSTLLAQAGIAPDSAPGPEGECDNSVWILECEGNAVDAWHRVRAELTST